jgi:WD40 repeat protein
MISPAPYPGLRPFRISEAGIFFGRGEQINQMLHRLETRRFLAVVGTSGCGKSSLVRAGLLPALSDGFLANAPGEWRFAVLRPGDAPFTRLAEALHRCALGTETPAPEAVALTEATLSSGDRGILQAVRDLAIPTDVHLLVLVDQFEEIFRFRRLAESPGQMSAEALYLARNSAAAFVSQLLATVQAERPIHIVLTMRSDFLGDCDAFLGLPEAINDSQFLVPRLDREQMRAVIVEPLKVVGEDADRALTESLLNDTGTDPDQLPLLQHTLQRLWSTTHSGQAAGHKLSLDDYHDPRIGGLNQSLSIHADEAYDSLTEDQKPVAERMFRSLCDQDKEGKWIRRWRKLTEIAATAGVSWQVAVPVVEAFIGQDRNFLVIAPEGPLGAESTIDISHEALIRRWQRMQGWLRKEQDSARNYRRLLDAAQQWERGQSDTLHSPNLDLLLRWRENERPSVAWAESYGGQYDLAMRYLDESRRLQTERVFQAREEAKKRQRNKRIAQVSVVALIGAAIAVIQAVHVYGLNVHLQDLNADLTKKTKLLERSETEERQKAKDATLLRIGTQAQGLLAKSPELGLLLAAEALDRSLTGDVPVETQQFVEDTFRKAMFNIGGQGLATDQGKITSVVQSDSPTGNKWLATLDLQGKLRLWDVAGDRPNRITLPDAEGRFSSLMMTGDGRWLIALATGRQNVISLWPLARPGAKPYVSTGYHSLFVSLNGHWLLTRGESYESGKAKLIDLRKVDSAGKPLDLGFDGNFPGGRFQAVSSDDQWLVVVTSTGTPYVWKLDDVVSGKDLVGKRLGVPPVDIPPETVPPLARNCAFTDNSQRLVVALSNGTLRIWNRTGATWNKVGKETPLYSNKSVMRLVTDSQGLLALGVSGPLPKTLSESKGNPADSGGLYSQFKQSAPPPKPPSPQGLRAELFDLSRIDDSAPLQLAGWDETINLELPIAIDATRRWLIAKFRDPSGGLKLWDLKSKSASKPGYILRPPLHEYTDGFALSADGHWLVTRGRDNFVRLWDLWLSNPASSSLILRGHDKSVSAFAVSRTTPWLTTCSEDGIIRNWDLESIGPGAATSTIRNPPNSKSVTVTPDGTWLICSNRDGTVRFWNMAKSDLAGPPLVRRCWEKKVLAALKVSDDSRCLLAQDGATTVLWDLTGDGKPARRCDLDITGGNVERLELSPDGRWLAATVSGGNTSPGAARNSVGRIWRLLPGDPDSSGNRSAPKEVALSRGAEQVLGFTPSGKALFTLTGKAVHAWDVSGSKITELAVPLPDLATSDITGFRSVPNRLRLIVSHKSGALKLWDLAAIAAGSAKGPKSLLNPPNIVTPNGILNALLFSPNGDWSLLSDAKTVSAWDLTAAETEIASHPVFSLEPAPASGDAIASLDFHWLVIMGDNPETSRLFDLNSPLQSWAVPGVNRIRTGFITTDPPCLVGAADGLVHVWTLARSGPVLKGTAKGDSQITPNTLGAVSRDGHWLAAASSGAQSFLWDMTNDAKPSPTVLGDFHLTYKNYLDENRLISVDDSQELVYFGIVQTRELRRLVERTAGRGLTKAEWDEYIREGEYRPASAGEHQ